MAPCWVDFSTSLPPSLRKWRSTSYPVDMASLSELEGTGLREIQAAGKAAPPILGTLQMLPSKAQCPELVFNGASASVGPS